MPVCLQWMRSSLKLFLSADGICALIVTSLNGWKEKPWPRNVVGLFERVKFKIFFYFCKFSGENCSSKYLSCSFKCITSLKVALPNLPNAFLSERLTYLVLCLCTCSNISVEKYDCPRNQEVYLFSIHGTAHDCTHF